MAPNRPTAEQAPATITDLMKLFGDRWTILYQPDLRVWSGERRSPDGRHRRFIAGHAPADLASKLTTAELVER